MQFDINVWLTTYNKVHVLARQLKDSMPDWDGNAAICPLNKDLRDLLRKEIKLLTEKSARYLDQCDMKMSKPLWIYNPKDKKTWASHESFAYEAF